MAIPSDTLLSGQKYQRLVNSKHVRDIIANFDPLKVDEPLVSLRDGKFYLVDGQHTIASIVGLNGGKVANIMCRVIDGLTYEQEAGYYARQDEGRLAQTQYSKLNADREAKKKDAIDFFDMNDSLHIHFLGDGKKGGYCLNAIGTLYKMYLRFGGNAYYRVMNLILETWKGSPDSVRSSTIKAMFEFHRRYEKKYSASRFKLKCSSLDMANVYATVKIMDCSTVDGVLSQIVSKYNSGATDNIRL